MYVLQQSTARVYTTGPVHGSCPLELWAVDWLPHLHSQLWTLSNGLSYGPSVMEKEKGIQNEVRFCCAGEI